jgi:hypothetical protein
MEDQSIGGKPFDSGFSKEHKGGSLKLNGNFRDSLGQTFSRPKIEGHISPTPIVDRQFQCNKGLSFRIRSDIGFRAISGYTLASNRTLTVLSPHGASQNFFGRKRLNGAQDLSLLVTHCVRLERNGRLHSRQRDELKDMVGYHVP